MWDLGGVVWAVYMDVKDEDGFVIDLCSMHETCFEQKKDWEWMV